MSLKRISAIILMFLLLSFPALALAADTNLTPDQANQITEIHKQIMELKKKKVDKCVDFGQLTKEQGEQIKAKMDKKMKSIEENPSKCCPKPKCGQ